MSRVHMVNQNKPKLPRHHSGFGPWLIIAVIMAIGAGAMIASAVKAEPFPECEITGAVTDNLMSPEMAAFIVLHPGEYDETDMD